MNIEAKSLLDKLKSGEITKTEEIGHVSYYMVDKTPYSFHFYATFMTPKATKEHLVEVFYDLRNKKYFFKKNGVELIFNIANLDTVVPRSKGMYSATGAFNRAAAVAAFFEMVEVPENKGMYAAMVNAIGSMGEEKVDMTSRALIRLITDYNKLELLYKAGIDIKATHDRNFRELVYMASRNDVRKIHEIFDVSKSQFKFLREYITKTTDLAQAAREYHAKLLKKEDMDFYREFMKHLHDLDEKYGEDRAGILRANSTIFSFLDATWRVNTNYGAINDNTFYGFVAHYKISNPYKLAEYLLHECYSSQGLEYRAAFSDYKDYYMMCTDLEYENFTKYPRFLRTYHDIVTRNYKSIQDTLVNKKFSQAVEPFKYLETTIGDYAIVVPVEPKELVTEGNALHHCVGGYVKKVAEKRSLVVFLRDKKKTDESLVTVEIRDRKIVQVQGDIGRAPTAEERNALKRFAKQKELQY